MKKFTVGFIFNENMTELLLIIKNRPKWQAGKLNGIGGKVEENETFEECIIREVKEEANIEILDWDLIQELKEPDFQLNYYGTVIEDSFYNSFKSMTDEKVVSIRVDQLYQLNLVDDVQNLVKDYIKNISFQ